MAKEGKKSPRSESSKKLQRQETGNDVIKFHK
jgi:hypothetical protein